MGDTPPLLSPAWTGPEGGRLAWVTTRDGQRLRAGLWEGTGRGTVLLLNGRTEYIEKYGREIARLTAQGWSVLTLDWRGQGLSGRSLPGRSIGYVTDFSVYQDDLNAVRNAFGWDSLPQPRVLIAHSMGGCLGLRALVNGLDVAAAVFSAPMWGIEFGHINRLAPYILSGGTALGLGKRFAPGSSDTTYVMANRFEGNTLTSDPDEYARFQRNIRACPDLSLGGPSFAWVNAALDEIAALRAAPAPTCPILVLLGTAEAVVNPVGIRQMAARLPSVKLLDLPGARHEVFMEAPHIRAAVWEAIDSHLDLALGPA